MNFYSVIPYIVLINLMCLFHKYDYIELKHAQRKGQGQAVGGKSIVSLKELLTVKSLVVMPASTTALCMARKVSSSGAAMNTT